MATKTWIGGTTNWNTAGNWNGGVPTSADDAMIGTTAISPTIPLNSSFTVNTLTMNGTDTLSLGDNTNTGNSQGLTATNGFFVGGSAFILGQGTLTGNVTATGAATIGVKALNNQNTPQFTITGTITDNANALTLLLGTPAPASSISIRRS
jgi:hypothetical protein